MIKRSFITTKVKGTYSYNEIIRAIIYSLSPDKCMIYITSFIRGTSCV